MVLKRLRLRFRILPEKNQKNRLVFRAKLLVFFVLLISSNSERLSQIDAGVPTETRTRCTVSYVQAASGDRRETCHCLQFPQSPS